MKESPFLTAYRQVQNEGRILSPRGERIIEIENGSMSFGPEDSIISSFEARHLNLKYCKQEFLWYLRGDRFDTSIEQHATMWKKLRQADGGFNSNYGQYLFGPGDDNQFAYAMEALVKDRDSRRSAISLLNKGHLYHENSDIVCTYGISFRIREDRLNMSVNMRSNDLIFGATNDVFCFGLIHRMALVTLQTIYPELTLGVYHHKADSLHVYERHFEMLETLIMAGVDGFTPIDIPTPTVRDFEWLTENQYRVCFDDSLEFSSWLTR